MKSHNSLDNNNETLKKKDSFNSNETLKNKDNEETQKEEI